MIEYKIYKHLSNPNINKGEIINYVVYGHSSFLDMLNIQIDYVSTKGHLTLFIDKNDLDLEYIYKKFNKVVFYNNNDMYAQRLISCINQIDYEYFLLLHDIDILFDSDNSKILELLHFLKENDFDRIDFQLAYDFDRTHRDTITDDDLYLIKSNNTDTTANGYLYNVNPSIWKRETLLKILNNFSNRDYRNIEEDDVQKFCLQFNIFKLFSKKTYRCGYFICLEPFKFLHLTHSRKIFNIRTLPKECCKDILYVYDEIVEKYNLRKSSKWID